MRKVLILLLSLCIAFSFLACGKEHSEETSKHHFYYLRSDILYGAEDGVISCEYRERDNTDGETLLKQYLLGPISEDLVSPYPAGTALDSIKLYDDSLLIFLSDEFAQLSDLEYTLACACLAKTCFSIFDVSIITIRVAGADQSITLSKDSLTLVDTSDTIHATIGTEAPNP